MEALFAILESSEQIPILRRKFDLNAQAEAYFFVLIMACCIAMQST
jgi:hypothetical protein